MFRYEYEHDNGYYNMFHARLGLSEPIYMVKKFKMEQFLNESTRSTRRMSTVFEQWLVTYLYLFFYIIY